MTSTYIIDLNEAIPDIAYNVIHNSEHYQIPSEVFESVIIKAVKELVDDFAENPEQYIKPHHESQIDRIAEEYLNS